MGEGFFGLRAVARALVVNGAGEVLLCRSRNGQAWVPPGGTLDPGETLPVAAAREAEEEAGVRVTVGRMLFLNEFRPAHRDEHVIEVGFLCTPVGEEPEAARDRVEPAGPPERPWAAWHIQDVDGPRRLVRWMSQAEIAASSAPVFPAVLREPGWQEPHDPYLGLVKGK